MNTGNRYIDEHIHIVKPAKPAKTSSSIHVENIKGRYTEGWVMYNGKKYNFAMMNFLEGSPFGINKGCISRLEIGIVGPNKKWDTKVWYDRGWDKKPQTDDVKAVYRMLLRKFNSRMPEEYIIPWMRENRLKKWTDSKTGKVYSTEQSVSKRKSTKKEQHPFGL